LLKNSCFQEVCKGSDKEDFMATNRLGELLVRNQLIDNQQLNQALEDQKLNGGRIGTCLVRLGFVKEEDGG